MASISSIISFVVLLLATYSYSAPITAEFQNNTLTIALENSTIDIPLENATTIIHEQRSGQRIEKDDSDSSEEGTTVYATTNEYETSTGDELTTEYNHKREMENETEAAAEREIEDETSTADELTTEYNHKQEMENKTEEAAEREVEDETTTDDVTTVESSTETYMKHYMGTHPFESSTDFNKRAIGSIQSAESVESSTTDENEPETSTFQVSSSADKFAKSTGLVGEKYSSTSESETTVEPVEKYTSTSESETTVEPVEKYATTSSVEMENSTKIIAVIPGRIAETKLVTNPVKSTRVAIQHPLSQGQNQPIVEETKSHN